MESPDPSPNKKSNQYNSYLRYSGLAVQLLAAIGFFGWLGYFIDSKLGLQFPVFMLLLGFLAFGGMMLQVYRSIKRDNP
jgi:F0F1-type ATP synthase assembly protein I